MLKTDMPNYDINGDPVPNVASDAEIEIAEQLRHQMRNDTCRNLATAASAGDLDRCEMDHSCPPASSIASATASASSTSACVPSKLTSTGLDASSISTASATRPGSRPPYAPRQDA